MKSLTDWLPLLACPCCRQDLILSGPDVLQCRAGGHSWPVHDGIPDLRVGATDDNPRAVDRAYDGIWGSLYAAYMNRAWLQVIDSWILGIHPRRYWTWVQQRLEAVKKGPVVEVPIGSGPHIKPATFYSHLPWIGIDLSLSMLRRVQRKCARLKMFPLLLQADARQLPLRTGCARAMISLFGFHCFNDPEKVTTEMSRVMEPHGHFVLTALTLGHSTLSDLAYRLHERDGTFAPGRFPEKLQTLLTRNGLSLMRRQMCGAAMMVEGYSNGYISRNS